MNKLTCEMCGSTDLIKQDGVFVCQICGCKYSVEEAKKMMIEGTVEVTGTVKIDNTAAIENYLEIARNGINAENGKEAEDYCNRVIEVDSNNWEAWFLKGKAVSYRRISPDNNYVYEILNAFSRALRNCPPEQMEQLQNECKEILERIQTDWLQLKIKIFSFPPNANDINNLKNAISSVLKNNEDFSSKSGIEMKTVRNARYAKVINNEFCTLWGEVLANYQRRGSNIPEFIGQTDNLLEGFNLAIELCGEGFDYKEINDLKHTIYDNMRIIVQTLIDKKVFLPAERLERRRLTYYYQYKINELRSTGEQQAIEASEKRRDEYWIKHSEEKEKLENQKNSLKEQIDTLKEEISSMPEKEETERIDETIKELKAEQKALGMFKTKEKKAIQKKIDYACAEQENAVNQLNVATEEIEKKIQLLQNQMDEIETELTRGR